MIYIYPPNLKSTQPAFSITKSSYSISFSLPAFMSYGDVKHVQVRLVKQANNQTMANLLRYSDGIIYKNKPTKTDDSGAYVVVLDQEDLGQRWTPGTVYKIQMRFGTTDLWAGYPNATNSFAAWKQAQIENQTFSEWSTVMVVKAIEDPKVEINGVNSGLQFVKTTTPLFEGTYVSAAANNEAADKFEYILLDNNDNLIETSGKQQYRGSGSMSWRFKTVLAAENTYTVLLQVTTVNGFEPEAARFNFIVQPLQLEELSGVDFYSYATDLPYCERNGCVKLYVQSEERLDGNYVITRSDETTNFTIWQDIKYFLCEFNDNVTQLTFTDFAIESGVQYRYALQAENSAGLRTIPLASKEYPDEHKGDAVLQFIYERFFDYSYLYRDNLQLRLQFNQKLNSFKHTVLRSKQDTLGGKFPHLANNGYAYYAEFPISGLITLQADEDQTFFKWTQKGLMCGDSLVAPIRMFEKSTGRRFLERPPLNESASSGKWSHKTGYSDGTQYAYTDDEVASEDYQTTPRPEQDAQSLGAAAHSPLISSLDGSISTDLTNTNIYIERKVREYVEAWLNDFTYKLYKSPTEGNIVIGLLNVSLTPKQELGRMVFEFSATAYELAEHTIEDLNELGIITIGSRQSVSVYTQIPSFGQINEVYKPGTDLVKLMKIQQMRETSQYKYALNSVSAFWIDRYPLYIKSDIEDKANMSKLDYEIKELKSALSDAEHRGDVEAIKRLEAEIDQKETFQNALEESKINADQGITFLRLNGADTDILVMPGRVYQVNEDITQLILTKTDYPIVVNYLCTLAVEISSESKETVGVDNPVIWNQTAGVFTTNNSILRSYNYSYAGLQPYRVYTPGRVSLPVTEQDASNYNVYKTQDILAAIEVDVRKQVEYQKNTTFTYSEEEGWNDGHYYYTFKGFTKYSIEGNPGTIIRLNGENITLGRVMLADHSNLKLQPGMSPIYDNQNNIIGWQYSIGYYSGEGDITELVVPQPTFLIVNYKCQTQVQTKAVVGSGG